MSSYEEDPIKSRGARVFTTLYIDDVLVTCKYEVDPIKNEGARVLTTFSQL